jgi:molybdenum cofactor biosynthesis protein B
VGVDDHKAHAPPATAIRVFIVTASDSRTPETNQGGQLVRELAQAAGFAIAGETLLPDDRDAIRQTLSGVIARRENTVEAVAGLLEKRIDGYGELFRMLSFAEIGAAAMLSRAIAGTIGRVAVFAMPGSPAGVRLAMERLIVPELAHVVGELSRRGGHKHHGHGHDDGHHRH